MFLAELAARLSFCLFRSTSAISQGPICCFTAIPAHVASLTSYFDSWLLHSSVVIVIAVSLFLQCQI